ncbi:LysE family translocator [Halomonas sp. M5N1S17]|uniref:LysE family translocator n=1 Tax=Halomonas alkalisoli TaxID=2907158 RepID=UPI001F1701B0|nr:LysE family translocator [Halomonas alkalisoli]MCE9663565.1 LysE family translocator [Halomonas alkalisoli]
MASTVVVSQCSTHLSHWESPLVSIEFLLTSLVVAALPGTGVIFTLAAGVTRGVMAGILAAAGCTLGIVPHMAAATLGLAPLLHTSAVAFQFFKFAGVGYLLYLAWCTLKQRGALSVEQDASPQAGWRIMASAAFVNLLNPKLTIFFLAFLPQFVDASESTPLLRMLELSAVFMVVTLVVFSGYGTFAAVVRNHLFSRPGVLAWMRRGFAAAFVALGFRLALMER